MWRAPLSHLLLQLNCENGRFGIRFRAHAGFRQGRLSDGAITHVMHLDVASWKQVDREGLQKEKKNAECLTMRKVSPFRCRSGMIGTHLKLFDRGRN